MADSSRRPTRAPRTARRRRQGSDFEVTFVGGIGMAPTLLDGDLVYIDKTVTAQPGHVVAWRHPAGRMLLGRLQRNAEGDLALVLGSSGKPVMTALSDEVARDCIVGVVTYRGSAAPGSDGRPVITAL